MPRYTKKDFPVSEIRRFLEPGPIVLVSSACEDQTNIMTMGWHMMMEFSPALVGCLISSGNHSFELVRKSRQCVINVPTVDIAAAVVRIGNCSHSFASGRRSKPSLCSRTCSSRSLGRR